VEEFHMSDVVEALERVRPSAGGTVAQGRPGYVLPIALTAGAGTATRFRPDPATGSDGSLPQYVSLKLVGASGYIAFGDANTPDPTTNGFLQEPGDSIQDWQLEKGDTHIRIRGTGTGTAYLLISGR
jgi:hypothetical protein